MGDPYRLCGGQIGICDECGVSINSLHMLCMAEFHARRFCISIFAVAGP